VDFVAAFGNQRVVMARGGDKTGTKVPNLVGFPARDSAGKLRARADAGGDHGLIGINSASPYINALRPWVLTSENKDQGVERSNPTYRIGVARRNQENTTVCISGYRSGTRCGEVEQLGEDFTDPETGRYIGSVAAVQMYECTDDNPNTQLLKGDSGGAVWKRGAALGLVSGKDEENGCTSYISGATVAECDLDIDILPTDGPKTRCS
jgi:hypothetical protein